VSAMPSVLPVVAAVLACLYLPVPFIMAWFHAFDPVWKRMGVWSYLLHVPVYLSLVAATATLYRVWPAIAWPWHPAASALGAALVAGAFALLFSTHSQVDFRTLIAAPQVTGARDRALLTSGVYARIRHPRYTVLMVGALGNFLLTGYELLLAAFFLTTAATIIMTQLEERELVAHFGDAYRLYRERVPAFFPLPGHAAKR
jgi:protein-S-isoprenylcysteine O-methyltransferase Ste14